MRKAWYVTRALVSTMFVPGELYMMVMRFGFLAVGAGLGYLVARWMR